MDIFRKIMHLKYQNDELIYCNVWRDTCRNMDWTSGLPSISPGRTAVGYNYLYVITRILNEIQPHNVLDIGLGISSSLISHYFNSMRNQEDELFLQNANHIVVEHDKRWIDFYTQNHVLSDMTQIMQMELIANNKKQDYCYKDMGG